MLLTLSFFLEKMRFEAGLGAGHLEAATPDSTTTDERDERQASNATSDHRALHSVQFSKRVSEIKKPAHPEDLHHLHPDADSSGILALKQWKLDGFWMVFLVSFHGFH